MLRFCVGRFITRHPDGGYLQNSLSQHPYQYAYDNPINLDDPSGEQVIQLVQSAVYWAIGGGGIKYIGITNNIARRTLEHVGKFNIQAIRGLQKLNRADARAVEQALIERFGLKNLDNKINSISKNNPIYQEAIKKGNEILKSLGL